MALRSSERARGYVLIRTPTIDNIHLEDLADVAVSSLADGEYLRYNGVSWVNEDPESRFYTEAEVDSLLSSKSDVGHTHPTSDIVSGTFANARISESSVTQHEAAITITESQISDLQSYLISSDVLGLDSLVDPNADRILFWDDSAGSLEWLDVGTGLSISGTTLSATGGGGSSSLAGLDDTNISGTQATGDVLYWDGTDWADTGSINITLAGAVTLDYNGSKAFETTSTGLKTTVAGGGNDGSVEIVDGDGESFTLFKVGATGAALIRNNENSGQTELEGTNAGGSIVNLFVGDPDGAASLWHSGVQTALTQANGLDVQSSSDTPSLRFRGTSTQFASFFRAVGDAMYLDHQTNGESFKFRGRTSGGATVILVDADPDGSVGLYYNGTEVLKTVDNDTLDGVSGAEVKDYGGTYRPVGFLNSERVDVSSNHTVDRDDWGKTLRALSGITNLTFNTENNIPNDVMLIVIARNTSLNLVQGSGVTLRWFDGSTSGGSIGNRVLANGGIVSVMKFGDSEYYLWGNGLS